MAHIVLHKEIDLSLLEAYERGLCKPGNIIEYTGKPPEIIPEEHKDPDPQWVW